MLAPRVSPRGRQRQSTSGPEATGGPQRVKRLLVGLLRPDRFLGCLRLTWVNGPSGAVIDDPEGRVVSMVELNVADSIVQVIGAVINHGKLSHLRPSLTWRDCRPRRTGVLSGSGHCSRGGLSDIGNQALGGELTWPS